MIPRNTELSLDSKVILLLCSDLIKCDKVKSFTKKEWEILAKRIANSPIQTPKGFYEIDSTQWSDMLGISSEMADRIDILLSFGGQLAFELERLDNRGIWVITRAEKIYPNKLKTSLKYNSPILLYGSGNIDILNGKKLGVVGSREIENNEIEYINKLVKKSVSENYTIVSGGSRGTDSVAENASLQNGGKVVSVLSEELEKYIQKKEIRNEIIKERLLVISPYNPKATFKTYNALGRNKYIYGLSDSVIVISAIENKGGTWKGAIENLQYKISPMFVKESLVKSGNIKLQQMGVGVLKTEILQNENEKLSSWFSKNENSDILLQYEQLSFEDMLNDKNKPIVSRNVVNNIKEPSIFDIVWPVIEKYLSVERTSEWLCKELNIRKVQLDDWLNHAENLGLIKKKIKPNRYINTIRHGKH